MAMNPRKSSQTGKFDPVWNEEKEQVFVTLCQKFQQLLAAVSETPERVTPETERLIAHVAAKWLRMDDERYCASLIRIQLLAERLLKDYYRKKLAEEDLVMAEFKRYFKILRDLERDSVERLRDRYEGA